MKTVFQLSVILAAMSLIIVGCDKDDPVTNPYEDCCGNTPVEFSLTGSEAHVYIPNVFTPNGDAINDFFRPYSNDYVTHINSMVISDNDIGDERILFQVENVIVDDFPNNSWNGRNPEGVIHKGRFKYQISFQTTEGSTFITSGNGCSIVCDDDAQIFKTLPNCFFGTQNSIGHLDTNIPIQEFDCFK